MAEQKRTSSPARKARCAASWAQGQKRKDGRRGFQQDRERANRANSLVGILTPWEVAQYVRKMERNEDPRVQARRAYWQRVQGVSAVA